MRSQWPHLLIGLAAVGEPLVWTGYEPVPEWITRMGVGAIRGRRGLEVRLDLDDEADGWPAGSAYTRNDSSS